MYGEGFKHLRARYKSKGSDSKGIDMRCEITVCMTSPDKTYSLIESTACLNLSSEKPEMKSVSSTLDVGVGLLLVG